MKIHSSSLASIPARHKANNHNETQNSKASNKENSLQDRPVLEHQTPVQIEDNLKSANLLHISKSPQNFSVNSRTHHALDAYIQENNQPIKNQRSELVAGIDFFV